MRRGIPNGNFISGKIGGEPFFIQHDDGSGTLERIFLPADSLLHGCRIRYDEKRGCYAFEHPVEIRPLHPTLKGK